MNQREKNEYLEAHNDNCYEGEPEEEFCPKYADIQALEHDADHARKMIACTWDVKANLPCRFRQETAVTLALFEAYGDYEPEWRAGLFKKLV